MRPRVLAVLAAVLLAAPASAGEPDFSGMLRLVGRFAWAHACPVGPRVALTNAHVTDLQPFMAHVPLYPFDYSDGLGNEGIVAPPPASTWADRDLGVLVPVEGEFARWYPIATEPPKPGEKLYFLGFDFRKGGDAFKERAFEAVVLRRVAGHVVLTKAGSKGSSGSCALNSRSEVVGINAWGPTMENGEEVAVVVGLWGAWRERVFKVLNPPAPPPAEPVTQ